MEEIVKILQEKEKTKRTFLDFLLDFFDIIAFLVFVGGIVLFIRFFIFNPYTVVGQSMEPTFGEKDFIIVDKITPTFGEIKRGDIVVFVPPGKEVTYIKRIIGLPGDTIKLINNKVNLCQKNLSGEKCELLNEPYITDSLTKPICNIDEFKVTSGSYFVLGDNRNHSTDSRCCFGFGCYNNISYLIRQKDIIGVVYVRVFPTFKKF